MPWIVSGKQFYQANMPGAPAPSFDFQVLSPVHARGTGSSAGTARYEAEHQLAKKAGDAEAVVHIEYEWTDNEREVICETSGVPAKRLPV